MTDLYIVTIREAIEDKTTKEITAGKLGVDLALNTNDRGHLVFPHDLFMQAKAMIARGELEDGSKAQ